MRCRLFSISDGPNRVEIDVDRDSRPPTSPTAAAAAKTRARLTDVLSPSTHRLQICPGPKGILGTKGGGLLRLCVVLGVQKLDTKGVPVGSDGVANAAEPAGVRVLWDPPSPHF